MNPQYKKYAITAACVVVAAIVVGTIATGLWKLGAALLALLGVGTVEAVRMGREEQQAAKEADKAAAQKEQINQEWQSAEAGRKAALKARQRQRAIEEQAARERRRKQAESADPDTLRDNLLKEADDALKE